MILHTVVLLSLLPWLPAWLLGLRGIQLVRLLNTVINRHTTQLLQLRDIPLPQKLDSLDQRNALTYLQLWVLLELLLSSYRMLIGPSSNFIFLNGQNINLTWKLSKSCQVLLLVPDTLAHMRLISIHLHWDLMFQQH
jgi:hypothetical protein